MIDFKLILILIMSVVIYILFNRSEKLKNRLEKVEISLKEKNKDDGGKKDEYLENFYENNEESVIDNLSMMDDTTEVNEKRDLDFTPKSIEECFDNAQKDKNQRTDPLLNIDFDVNDDDNIAVYSNHQETQNNYSYLGDINTDNRNVQSNVQTQEQVKLNNYGPVRTLNENFEQSQHKNQIYENEQNRNSYQQNRNEHIRHQTEENPNVLNLAQSPVYDQNSSYSHPMTSYNEKSYSTDNGGNSNRAHDNSRENISVDIDQIINKPTEIPEIINELGDLKPNDDLNDTIDNLEYDGENTVESDNDDGKIDIDIEEDSHESIESDKNETDDVFIENLRNMIKNENITKYKLQKLQSFAKELNIDINKVQNGKSKNKTKRELWREISNNIKNI